MKEQRLRLPFLCSKSFCGLSSHFLITDNYLYLVYNRIPMKIKLLLASLALALGIGLQAQVLTKVDSLQVSQANIWGVTGDDGDSLSLTTTFSVAGQPHIFLRKVDYTTISNQSAPKQISFGSDYANGRDLTDHKHIVFNNEIYVAFSTQGDQEVFLFKTDINGNRIGNLVTVFQGAGFPCNDMMLTTDSTSIYVLIFAPPSQSRVFKFDVNLNPVGSPFTTTTLAHNNLGGAVHQNGQFYMYTGSQFGFNSNLILSEWTSAFAPNASVTQTLMASAGGDGNFFSTGIAYYAPLGYWIIGFNHINNGQSIGQEHLDIAVFDASFNLLERNHVTGNGFFRPHYVIKGNYLYVSYDATSSVHLLKYQIGPATGINGFSESEPVLYPNPASGKMSLNSKELCSKIEITDNLGKNVLTLANSNSFDVSGLPAGIYSCKFVLGNKTIFKKLVKE